MTNSNDNQTGGRLDGRVVVVTGAGRGLGAGYARLAASLGAAVVVNDRGGSIAGEGSDTSADSVVKEILEAGGKAVVSRHDVSDPDDAHALVALAVAEFGDLHAVINNAGILRDAMLVTMTPEAWDAVLAVHARGHFLVTQAAAQYWRAESKEGRLADRVAVQTTSIAGLHGNVGQFNYSTAKAGIASMVINGHLELNERLKVRSYGIAPGARTRLTESTPGADAVVAPQDGTFDFYAPENVAPFVVWLLAEGNPAPSGTVFGVEGDIIRRYRPWSVSDELTGDGQWSMETLDQRAAELWPDGSNLIVPASEIIQQTFDRAATYRTSS